MQKKAIMTGFLIEVDVRFGVQVGLKNTDLSISEQFSRELQNRRKTTFCGLTSKGQQ